LSFPGEPNHEAGPGICGTHREGGIVVVPDQINPSTDQAVAAVSVCRIDGSGATIHSDFLAVEEPLEIRLGCMIDGRRSHRGVSVTMRTSGHDGELAVGFLFTEGIITTREQITDVRACGAGNVVRVELRPEVAVDLARLERHFYTASSCGVCGKTSLEAVCIRSPYRPSEGRPIVAATVIHRLPETLRAAQAVFDRTGGLHAAALFDIRGTLLCLREDVGRHNALDKLIGSQFLARRTPLSESVLLVSGRASFELVQKAMMAGIPVLAAVGAPSSLAVDLAREHGLTLLGFVRADRFNIYTGADRIGQGAAVLDVACVPEVRVQLSVV
jgi:FdhD protein